jgi:quercetin dioxygenase-like cupin family protein
MNIRTHLGICARSGMISILLLLTGCASGPPAVPYPAFIQADELPDVFIAALPGIRAKQFAGDPSSRRTSNRLQLPADWKGSTGASPGKSVELFVVSGEITLGSMVMRPGSYAYIPPGFTGSNISTSSGAVVLYFLDDPNPAAVIQTPLLLDSNLVDWRAASDEPEDFGYSVKELRLDPGSGARTWLLRIDPGATQGWHQASTTEEGYLLSGMHRHSECVEGEVATHDYMPGGYFARPPGAIHGGPEAKATATSVWYLRRMAKGAVRAVPACAPLSP